MQKLSTTMEQVHTVKKYRACYKEYTANPSDKAFFEEYKAQITLYENALSELKKSYSKLLNSKDILAELDKLQEKKRIPLCKSILPQNLLWTSFIKYERTMEFTWARRWRDDIFVSLQNIFNNLSSPLTKLKYLKLFLIDRTHSPIIYFLKF